MKRIVRPQCWAIADLFQQIHILLHKSVAIGLRRDLAVSEYQWQILRYASCIMVMRVKLVHLT